MLSRRSRGRPQQTPLGKRQLSSDQPMQRVPWHACFLFSCIQPICPSPNCTGCSIWPSGTGRIKCSNLATSAKSSGKGCLRHSTGSERWHLQRGAVAVTGRAGWDSAARQGATSLTRGYRLRWSCGAIPNWTTKVPQLSTLFPEKNLESLTWQNTGKRSWHGGGGVIDSPRHRQCVMCNVPQVPWDKGHFVCGENAVDIGGVSWTQTVSRTGYLAPWGADNTMAKPKYFPNSGTCNNWNHWQGSGGAQRFRST